MALEAQHILLLIILFACLHKINASSKCPQLDTIDFPLREVYCNQPYFYNFVPKTPENQLLDNGCITLFPLPDDPSTFTLYMSFVYCDGSNSISSFIATDISKGTRILAHTMQTWRDSILGYAGCDTYIFHRCLEFGGKDPLQTGTYGFSSKCEPIGLSCLRKVQEIINDRCLPDDDYYVLPMKLPNRCVTQQLCLQPPNPFYNKLPSVTLF